MQKQQSGKQQFWSGFFQLAWAELKTMNVPKIKSLYKMAVGYFLMRRSEKKRLESSYKLTQKTL